MINVPLGHAQIKGCACSNVMLDSRSHDFGHAQRRVLSVHPSLRRGGAPCASPMPKAGYSVADPDTHAHLSDVLPHEFAARNVREEIQL